MKRIFVLMLAVSLSAALLAGCAGAEHSGDESAAPQPTAVQEPPADAAPATQAPAEPAAALGAVIEVEGYGSIAVELDAKAAPVTVANFVQLAESGFYDGLTFHRIMQGFMIQGGCPLGNGTGGAESDIVGEFALNGHDNPISHTRGAISMARSNDPDSASSQFFIVHEDSVFLDGQYASFGRVTEGMEVVDAICADAQPLDGNGTIAPAAQPVITSITITR